VTALRCAVALGLCGVPIAASAQTPLAGTWHGVVTINGMRCTFDRVTFRRVR
jgi:hypothetical protein